MLVQPRKVRKRCPGLEVYCLEVCSIKAAGRDDTPSLSSGGDLLETHTSAVNISKDLPW